MAINSLSNLGERTALAAVSGGTLYIGLYRTKPANGGAAGTEIGTGTGAQGYARQAVTFSAPATDTTSGVTSCKNTGPSTDVRFPAAASTTGTTGWGLVEGIGIFTSADTATDLVPLWYGELTGGNKTLNQGDVILFENDQIVLTMQ